MKKQELGKLKMHAQGIMDCIDAIQNGTYGVENDDDDEDYDEEGAPAPKSDSGVAVKSLAMKLGKYK